MKNFRTYELALDLYKEYKKLKVKELEIRDQLARASLSIILNIAEGSGKSTNRDRRKFYAISMGRSTRNSSTVEHSWNLRLR